MSRYDALVFVEKLFDLPALSDEPGGDSEGVEREPRGWIGESLDRLRVICVNCLQDKKPGSEKCLDYLRTRQMDWNVVLATGVIGAVPADLDISPILEAAREAYSNDPVAPLFSVEEMAIASAAKRAEWAEIEQKALEMEAKKFENFVEGLRKVPGYGGMIAIYYQDQKDDFVHVEFLSGRGKDRRIYSIKPDRAGVFAPPNPARECDQEAGHSLCR